MLANSEEDVFAFLKEYSNDENFKVVLKPQKGAGSVGVTFCNSPMAVWTAFDTIMGGSYCDHCTYQKHYNNDGVFIHRNSWRARNTL